MNHFLMHWENKIRLLLVMWTVFHWWPNLKITLCLSSSPTLYQECVLNDDNFRHQVWMLWFCVTPGCKMTENWWSTVCCNFCCSIYAIKVISWRLEASWDIQKILSFFHQFQCSQSLSGSFHVVSVHHMRNWTWTIFLWNNNL